MKNAQLVLPKGKMLLSPVNYSISILFPTYTQRLPANIHFFKANNKNSRKRCELCTKLTMKNQNDVKTSFWCFLCYIWTCSTRFSSVLIVDFEQGNVSWLLPTQFVNMYSTKNGFSNFCKIYWKTSGTKFFFSDVASCISSLWIFYGYAEAFTGSAL